MERHSLLHTEGYETTETKEIFDKLEIKEEAIEIHTEIYEKSNESLCLNDNDNDNSIPFCNILLSKFLDLTPEQRPKRKKNKLQDGEKEVDIQVAINKDKINSDSERQKCFRQDQKMKKQKLQDGQEEVDIDFATLNKRKLKAERQKLYRQRLKMIEMKLQDGKELVDIDVAALNKPKKQAKDSEAAINKRKKGAERQKRFRERRKLENDDNQRKKECERKRRFLERKKNENPELYAAIRAEAQRLHRLKKKELQDVNEEVDIEVAIIQPEINTAVQNQ